nr:hypothetical protein [Tanacetum cinerariifolium]
MPLPEDCTAVIIKKKLRISFNTHLSFTFYSKQDMDQQYPTVAKIPMLDTRKFKQWQFRMQQYLQHEHYALWEVIEFGDSYEAPKNNSSTTTTSTTTTSTISGDKSGRTVTLTIEDMQKKKNDVKARTTLLLSLPDEHQLQFSKHKTAKELWAVILKTFGGNEATKKTKKNPLKQQYENFRAEGSETLEQTFTRLQVIVGELFGIFGKHNVSHKLQLTYDHLQSGRTVTLTTEDVQKKKNDVKARTTLLLSLPDEHQLRFSMHKTAKELWVAILKTFDGNEATKKTKKNLLKQQYGNFRAEGSETLEQTFTRLQVIVEVQKKSEPNTQNMAFISSTKHSKGNDEVNTASSNVPTTSANITTASISQETACAYIASQFGGSQINFEDINQINEDDMEEMDIKWNMALLSMRADKFWKKTGKKISIQGSDVAGFDKSKVECFNCHKMGHFTSKALMAIDGVGWDWSYMVNDEEDHALVAEAPTEFALMADTSTKNKELETLKQEKEVVDGKLVGLLLASKDLDNLIESQRSDKSKEGLGYTVVPPPVAQLYLSPKKDLSWTGLSECADETVTDYSRPSPIVESSSEENQNRNPSASESVASPITPKQFVKFVKASDSQSEIKTDEKETPKKITVKIAKQYRKSNKKPNVRGNQRNWNNLKSHQLGPDFVMKK